MKFELINTRCIQFFDEPVFPIWSTHHLPSGILLLKAGMPNTADTFNIKIPFDADKKVHPKAKALKQASKTEYPVSVMFHNLKIYRYVTDTQKTGYVGYADDFNIYKEKE